MGSANALVRVSAGLRSRGVDAPRLLNAINEVTGGKGGGRPDRAMGSLPDPARRQAALDAVRETLRTAGSVPA
jgi:alanyl-tRNA synthetase